MLSFDTAFSILVTGFYAVAVVDAADEFSSIVAESLVNTLHQSNYCPQDIFKTDGDTNFPEKTNEDPSGAPITIVGQDASTVTVELRQQWFPNVDSIHYAFQEYKSREKCYEETFVEMGELYDTVTIQCDSENPWAELAICLSDNEPNGNLFDGDVSEFPEICHKVYPGIEHEEDNAKTNDKPTVCYSLRIRCESLCVEDVARKRGLRGEHSLQ